jgi:hypothetical protein
MMVTLKINFYHKKVLGFVNLPVNHEIRYR